MGLETQTLSSYLTKRIKQLKKDHARLDLEKANEKTLLRLELEENDLRHCIEAIKALEGQEKRNTAITKDLQHKVTVKDRQLMDAQTNIDLIMESFNRASTNEDNMLKWIMERKFTNA